MNTSSHGAQSPAPFPEISVVRVRQLLTPDGYYSGAADYERAPQVGDTGTIVGVFTSPGQMPACEVECVVTEGDGAGYPYWIATFGHEELELVHAHEERST